MNKPDHPKVGDIWLRVDGVPNGDETWDGGAELTWQEWRVVKVTPCGAWLSRPYGDFHIGEPRFALANNCRWCHRTKEEALRSLIRRKHRHIQFLERDMVVARETLRLAQVELDPCSSTKPN